jgi:hypothetical protein
VCAPARWTGRPDASRSRRRSDPRSAGGAHRTARRAQFPPSRPSSARREPASRAPATIVCRAGLIARLTSRASPEASSPGDESEQPSSMSTHGGGRDLDGSPSPHRQPPPGRARRSRSRRAPAHHRRTAPGSGCRPRRDLLCGRPPVGHADTVAERPAQTVVGTLTTTPRPGAFSGHYCDPSRSASPRTSRTVSGVARRQTVTLILPGLADTPSAESIEFLPLRSRWSRPRQA